MKKCVVAASSILCLILAGMVLKQCLCLSSGDSHRPGPERLRKITGAKMTAANGRICLGRGWKERRQGYNLVSLQGEPYEMGYQHGALLREEIRSGVVPVFADFLSHTHKYRSTPPVLRWLMRLYLEAAVFRPLEDGMPEEYLQELKGIADGSGIDYRNLFIATFKSELTMLMTGGVISGQARSLGLAAECSSFAVSGPATRDGRLIFGRNTDYTGQGRWLRRQTVFICRPERGYAYINITTAGMIKCNVAMNSRGIVIGGHFMAFSGAAARGLPFTILEHEIMRRCATLEEAVALMRGARRATCFGFLVADGARGEAAVFETNGPLLGVRRQERHRIALTNFATTDELRGADFFRRYNLIMRDVAGRYERLRRLMDDHYGRITPELAASFMGDHVVAATGRERATGGTVGNVGTVTSAVFVPQDGIVWFGIGDEPACGGSYTPLDVRSLLQGTPARMLAPLRGYRWRDPSLAGALREYMSAYVTYSERPEDLDAVNAHLDRAIALDPREPIYRRVKALLNLNAGRRDALEESLGDPAGLEANASEIALHHFIYGIGFDLRGQRERALRHYREVARLARERGTASVTGINAILCALSAKFLQGPFEEDRLADIPIGFDGTSGLE